MKGSTDLNIAVREEIGSPDLFVGRQRELDHLLDWLGLAKKNLSKPMALLARRRMGKTALVQRFFNVLYTRNDSEIVPVYFRIPEKRYHLRDFSDLFYRTLLSHYFAFQTRQTEFIENPADLSQLKELAREDAAILGDIRIMQGYLEQADQKNAWDHAHRACHRLSALKDVRIVQILDAFQLLDSSVYEKEGAEKPLQLTSSHLFTRPSKHASLILTSCDVDWLSQIPEKMSARFDAYYLGHFQENEALAAVYNYARCYEHEISDESALWISRACNKDPYYIACIFESRFSPKDLTTVKGVREVLDFETSYPKGRLARLWFEYFKDEIHRVNDRDAKRVVLYLTQLGLRERTRHQIQGDLDLKMHAQELEERLQQLVAAGILARGKANWTFRGLDDAIFEMVFHKTFEPEGENLAAATRKIEERMDALTAQVAAEIADDYPYKDEAAEKRARYKVAWDKQSRLPLKDLSHGIGRPLAVFGAYVLVAKKIISPGGVETMEYKVYEKRASGSGMGLIVEATVRTLPSTTDQCDHLSEETYTLFFSEQSIEKTMQRLLWESGILSANGADYRIY